VLLEVAFVALWKLNYWDGHIPVFLGIFLCAFIIYAIAARFALTERFHDIPNVSTLIFVSAVVFRLTVLFTPPSLSEDFYRYYWDGRVQNAGFGPYDYAPPAPELKSLRDPYYEKINHKEFPTVYPPLAENLFFLFSKLSPNIIYFKFWVLLFDFLLIEILRRLLIRESLPPERLLLYAWNPLAVVEFAGSGHMDIIAISLLLFSFLLLKNSKPAASGALLAGATMTKFLPILALPWFVKRGSWKLIVALSVLMAVFLWEFYTPDLRMFRSLFTFYQKWWFNDSLFGILRKWLGGAQPARVWGAFFVCMSVIYCLSMRYSFYRSFLTIYGMIILFSPVVHPWYLCWMIPFFIFYPSVPWFFLAAWIPVAYLIRYLYPGGVWVQPVWLKPLVYIPFYTLLLFDLFTTKAQSSQ